jgi:ferritin-like metal-binding protein YciE
MAKSNQSSKSASKKNSTSGQSNQGGQSSQKATQTLEDLLKEEIKDIYSAETQLVEALPKIAKACYSEDLADAVTEHLQETKRQVERLEKAFSRLGIDKSEVEECAAMKGLIEEGNKVIEDFEESPVRDSALIIGSQKIEHYEIASYGSICELCDVLGYNQLCDLLGRSLDEEERTDQDLTELAQQINDEAYESSEHEEEEEEETSPGKSGSYVNKRGQLKSYSR